MGMARPARRLVAPLVLLLGASLLGPAMATAAPPKIATTLSWTASPNPAWVDEPITYTFTVTPIPDGGYVTRGGPAQYPVDPVTGTASFTEARTSAGTAEFQAWYSGTDAYLGSPPILVSAVAQQHPVVATMTLPDGPVGRGDGFDITVDLDEAPPTGTVLIQDMTNGNPGPTLASAAISGPMPMAVHVPGLSPGTYQIRVNFTGTNAYASDTTDATPLTVFDRPTTTTGSLAKNPTKWGEPTTVNVVVSPVPDEGGVVKITRDGSDQGWATMDWSTGHGTFALAGGDPGPHTVTASYQPASWPQRYAPSSTSISQTVSSTPIETDAPIATIVINGDAAVATEPYVVLTIHAEDASPPMSSRLSCDQVHWVQAGTTDGDYAWSLNDGTCPSTDGPKTIYAEIKDWYGNTTIVSDTIILEYAGPIGTIILADGSMVVLWPTVNVSVPAVDAGSGVAQVALSNDGANWTYRPYAPTQTWQLSSGDGLKTVYSKWRDGYGRWSATKIDTVNLDTTKPVGTISIAGGAATSRLTAVTLSVPATDASGVSQVALSNDGTTWTTRSYSATQSWTLPATNGTRTVYAKWKDAAGNWSAVKSDTIVLDTASPVVTAPTWRLGGASAVLVGGALPVRVSWTGVDATTGISRFHLLQQTDGGPFVTVSSTLSGLTLVRNLVPGHSYRFALRATDVAGNTSPWAYGPVFQLTAVQQSSTSVKYAGTWANSTSATWWGGTAKASSSAGSTAKLTFTGRQVAWIGLKAANRGKAQVFVNGVLTATVDLYAASQRGQQVVWGGSWSTSATRTVTIKVLGTAGRPRVDVDGFFVGN